MRREAPPRRAVTANSRQEIFLSGSSLCFMFRKSRAPATSRARFFQVTTFPRAGKVRAAEILIPHFIAAAHLITRAYVA